MLHKLLRTFERAHPQPTAVTDGSKPISLLQSGKLATIDDSRTASPPNTGPTAIANALFPSVHDMTPIPRRLDGMPDRIYNASQSQLAAHADPPLTKAVAIGAEPFQ